MNWRIKGVIQKMLSATPGGRSLNSQLQFRLGGLKNFDRNVDTKVIADWLVLASNLRKLGQPLAGREYLEIGTGWYPTLPTCFALIGARRVYTLDLHPLMNWDLTRRMVVRLGIHLDRIAHELDARPADLRERWEALSAAATAREFLSRANIQYVAPGDAAATGLDPGSIDVVFSNSVLEHVPRETILEFMRESRRILRSTGVAIHSVNCGDHYAYFDRTITQINYLQFSERQWKFWNNSLQYQNRLRANELVDLASQSGLEIVLDLQRPRRELLDSISRFSIAEEFRGHSPEQLCTTSVDFAARPPQTGA